MGFPEMTIHKGERVGGGGLGPYERDVSVWGHELGHASIDAVRDVAAYMPPHIRDRLSTAMRMSSMITRSALQGEPGPFSDYAKRSWDMYFATGLEEGMSPEEAAELGLELTPEEIMAEVSGGMFGAKHAPGFGIDVSSPEYRLISKNLSEVYDWLGGNTEWMGARGWQIDTSWIERRWPIAAGQDIEAQMAALPSAIFQRRGGGWQFAGPGGVGFSPAYGTWQEAASQYSLAGGEIDLSRLGIGGQATISPGAIEHLSTIQAGGIPPGAVPVEVLHAGSFIPPQGYQPWSIGHRGWQPQPGQQLPLTYRREWVQSSLPGMGRAGPPGPPPTWDPGMYAGTMGPGEYWYGMPGAGAPGGMPPTPGAPGWFQDLPEEDPTRGRGRRDPRGVMDNFSGAIVRTAGYFLRWLIVWELFSRVSQGVQLLVREMVELESISARMSFIADVPVGVARESARRAQIVGAGLGLMPGETRAALPAATAFGIPVGYGAMMQAMFGVQAPEAMRQLQQARYFTGADPSDLLNMAAGMYREAPSQAQELMTVMQEAGMMAQMTGLPYQEIATAMTGAGREMGVSPIQAATAMQRIANIIPDYMMEANIQYMSQMERGDLSQRLLDLGIATERGGRQIQALTELIYQLADAAGTVADTDALQELQDAVEQDPVYQWQRVKGLLTTAAAPGIGSGENIAESLGKIADYLAEVQRSSEDSRRILQAIHDRPEFWTMTDEEKMSVGLAATRVITPGITPPKAAPAATARALRGLPTMPGLEGILGEMPVTALMEAPTAEITYERFQAEVVPEMRSEIDARYQSMVRQLISEGMTRPQAMGLAQQWRDEIRGMGGIAEFAGGEMRWLQGDDWQAFQRAEGQGRLDRDFQWQRDITQAAFDRAFEQAGIETRAIEKEFGFDFEVEEFVIAFKDTAAEYTSSNERLARTMEILSDTMTGMWNIPSGQMPWIPLPIGYDVDTPGGGGGGLTSVRHALRQMAQQSGAQTFIGQVDPDDLEYATEVERQMARRAGRGIRRRSSRPGRGVAPSDVSGVGGATSAIPPINVNVVLNANFDGQAIRSILTRESVNVTRQVGRSYPYVPASGGPQ
jgi:hypothetical protein